MAALAVAALLVEQPLMYVGHVKFTTLAVALPGLSIPLPLPSSGEAHPPGR